jgi:hypothetical protein
MVIAGRKSSSQMQIPLFIWLYPFFSANSPLLLLRVKAKVRRANSPGGDESRERLPMYDAKKIRSTNEITNAILHLHLDSLSSN